MDSKKTWWDKFISPLSFNFFKEKSTAIESIENKQVPTAQNDNPGVSYGRYNTLFSVGYDGGKNFGEIGPIKNYKPEYAILRIRSWQAFLESEIAQTVLSKFGTWVIGKGLKPQSEPSDIVLKSEGITLDIHEFSKLAEARFGVFRKSKTTDYGGMKSLDKMANIAYKNSIIGGDVLVILRYEDNVTLQLIDGAHIQSPDYGSENFPKLLENGNCLINGVEIDPKGKHIRYYVRNDNNKFVTIEARSSETDLQIAFMVYGLEFRLENVRGLPLIAAMLETLKKLERYKEATVGSAEERQKIVLSIEHDAQSTGENPFQKRLSGAFDSSEQADLPKDINGVELANTVSATTNKQTVNLPNGAKLNTVDSKNELYFKDFYTVNYDLLCGTIMIPPNVAMSKYDSNFSASRAALKDWEHTLNVKRHDFTEQFYQPIYNFWLDIEILRNKINAPGYLKARINKDNFVLDTYRTVRFVGATVPHIDPVKEVTAERLKLGDTGADLPLTTVEAATESLNGGDSDNNFEQYSRELKDAKKLGIEQPKLPTEKAPIQQD